jgi:uncharacterized protein (TIGR03083 family)
MGDLGFEDMLALIEDRSAALRSAAGQADLAARVPGCPGWSVRDLVTHLGEVHRFWSAAVAAGPADQPPGDDQVGDREPHGDLLTWSAAAAKALTDSLRAAGPDRGCWTWWAASGAPMTAGAVARHQVQEATVHAFDAQQAAGRAEPLPPLAAADVVGAFLTIGLQTMGPWPHDPARMLLQAGDGGTWLVELGRDAARVTRQPTAPGPDALPGRLAAPRVTVAGTSEDFVLAFYRRQGRQSLRVSGDELVLQRLLDWSDLD